MSGKNKSNDSTRKGIMFHRSGSQAGQVLIESLLLMVISVGLLLGVLRFLQEQQTANKLTNAIWSGVAQMGEYGNWPNANKPVHPNSSTRVRLLDPK